MLKVAIIGGGSAGWLTAAWLSKKHSDIGITLIESETIPKIGVGESVTPHVSIFFQALGIPTHHWMEKTGAIYKFANKFINWKNNQGENEYFSFTPVTDSKKFINDNIHATDRNDWIIKNNKNSDYLLDLISDKSLDKFDKYFNSQFYYMEKNVMPFDGSDYLLNPLFSWSQHINADLASEYARDFIAKPNGVIHKQGKVVKVNKTGDIINSLELESGEKITADLFVDASGFFKVLINELDWNIVEYKDAPVNRAWVCQTDYKDPIKEAVNYTQSIAEPHGWRFKIGLYHRMGNGYCFSGNHISDATALDYFNQQVDLQRKSPRLLTWTPSRLEKVGKGNTVAVGLSYGFVEPLEANAFYIIINSIQQLEVVIDDYKKTNAWDFDKMNKKMSYALDDIADFIKVHYTLSQRTDTDFWNDMRAVHLKENHVELIKEKYKTNTMIKSLEGYSMFPDYMWGQLAAAWGIDTAGWYSGIDQQTKELAKLTFEMQKQRHDIISSTRTNHYTWLKETVFKGLENTEWEKDYSKSL
jgi:tryptophan halogenase